MAAFYRHLFLKATSKFFARIWLIDEDADPFAAEYAVVEQSAVTAASCGRKAKFDPRQTLANGVVNDSFAPHIGH